MKIYCKMETGHGKTGIEDRVLIGSTVLAGGSYRIEVSESDSLLCIAVADGVGGNSAGDIAAHIATNCLLSCQLPESLTAEELLQIIRDANMYIIEESRREPSLKNMATTLSGLCRINRKWLLFHVGNTRVYTWNSPYLSLLTTDHSKAHELRLMGMSDEEIERTGNATAITACLGNGDMVFAEALQVKDITREIETAQMLLLTSDGVHEFIPRDLFERSLQSVCDIDLYLSQALTCARENGSTDDLSIILVDLR